MERYTREANRSEQDLLISQFWGDVSWRAVPFVCDENFVDKPGAEVNASARQACIGEGLVWAPSQSDRRGV